MSKDIQWIEDDPIEGILPKEGWLTDYCSFTSGLEACTRFRFFTAACVLGAAINNKIFIHRGDKDLLPRLFPNPWILLLAPPGRGHKTSTINMGVNCLLQACPEARILADKITPESLVKALSSPVTDKEKIRIGPRDATGLVKAPELSVFFGKQSYNQGLVSLITDLYDWRPEWTSETIMRGKVTLRNNCISVLGASTPDWMMSMIPQDAFTGGFMSRYVMVEMPPKYLRRRSRPAISGAITWEMLVKDLRHFGRLRGEIEWTQEGGEYYDKYYNNLKPTGDVQKDAYLEREVEQMLRLAMLLVISSNREKVDVPDMQHALQLLKFLYIETEPRIERLTTNPRMKLTQEILDILKLRGKMSRQQLMKQFMRQLESERQFDEALRVLRIAGHIEDIGESHNPMYVRTDERR